MSEIDFYEDGVHMERVQGADTKCLGSDLSSRVVRRLELRSVFSNSAERLGSREEPGGIGDLKNSAEL